MFRKLVSSLPFSPALVGQIGFYIRRLRKEEATRKLGLVFTAMAVVMQSFAVFVPPEQALASSSSSIVPGGVTSIQQILDIYDAGAKGQNDFKDLMDYIGITRSELASLNPKVEYICSTDKDWISFGRQHHYSASEGELMHNVPRSNGGYSVFYSVPLYRFDSVNNMTNCYDSYVGQSSKVGTFSIMRKCANVQIKRNVQKFPRGHFVTATCQSVQGYAYDERQTGLPVKVYLFFGGPPGKGKQYGPINADRSTPTSPIGGSHGFSFSVADEYKKSSTPTKVWATLQPLPGWNQSTVQFDNAVEIPANCIPAAQPEASCISLSLNPTSRTKTKLSIFATANNGASITGYTATVFNKSGNKVYEKRFQTSSGRYVTDEIALQQDGEYTAAVVAHTTIGDRGGPGCETKFTVNPPDKCPYIGSGDLSVEDSTCAPCPHDSSLWVNDPNCVIKVSQAKEARNLTKNIDDANGTLAAVSDRIEFTVYTTNVGDSDVKVSVTEALADVLEYARLVDTGGGSFDEATKTLSWNDVSLTPQQTDTRHFVVQINDTIPATPRGNNDPAAFNCVITNSYGNTIEINVDCPPVKHIESAVKSLPATGPGENIAFATILLMVVTYFYIRSRLMAKEARIIRNEFSPGVA